MKIKLTAKKCADWGIDIDRRLATKIFRKLLKEKPRKIISNYYFIYDGKLRSTIRHARPGTIIRVNEKTGEQFLRGDQIV